jgi:hypothetical protein
MRTKPDKIDIAIFVVIVLMATMVACGALLHVLGIFEQIPAPGAQNYTPEVQNTEKIRLATDFKANFQVVPCDAAITGIYDLENFGEIEILCENSLYYGEIQDFSIALTQLASKRVEGIGFNAVICIYNTCSNPPIIFNDNAIYDVLGQYFRMEKKP